YTNLLLFGEEYSYGNIWHTLDGSACVQIDSSEEKISIAKINMVKSIAQAQTLSIDNNRAYWRVDENMK
ncbi:MAG: hypothetical protein K2N95_09485, partial [Lachnospiraceae bacterium]|nr:hypothetical protein [Lachnospiraceae bacterium]